MKTITIAASDMIYDKRLRLWRLKRKYGRFKRPMQVVKTDGPPATAPKQPDPNQLNLFIDTTT